MFQNMRRKSNRTNYNYIEKKRMTRIVVKLYEKRKNEKKYIDEVHNMFSFIIVASHFSNY